MVTEDTGLSVERTNFLSFLTELWAIRAKNLAYHTSGPYCAICLIMDSVNHATTASLYMWTCSTLYINGAKPRQDQALLPTTSALLPPVMIKSGRATRSSSTQRPLHLVAMHRSSVWQRHELQRRPSFCGLGHIACRKGSRHGVCIPTCSPDWAAAALGKMYACMRLGSLPMPCTSCSSHHMNTAFGDSTG